MPIGRSSDSHRSKMAISQSAYWVRSWPRLGGSSQVAWGSRKSTRGGDSAINASYTATGSLATSIVHSSPAIQVTEAVGSQQSDRLDHVVVTAAAVCVTAVAVVRRPVAVEGDAHLDPVLREQFAELLVQPDTIRVNPQVKVAYGAQGRVQPGDDAAHPVMADQQRLTAMQDHLH